MEYLKSFMRIALDEMPEDPEPIGAGEQATVVGYDDAGHIMVSWDNGRKLNLLPDVDKFHVVGMTESMEKNAAEIERSFDQHRIIQDSLAADESSRCPRCGTSFYACRGAVSRRIDQVKICDLCGQQEAIEDYLLYTRGQGKVVNVFVPAGKNLTGFQTEEADEGKQRLKVKVKPVVDWYIVKVWQGRNLADE